ncbi:helix-turn-helix transcriptional regulator [Rhizobium sp.]
MEPTSLVDDIYEAAVIPEKWPAICDRLAASANGFSASVVTMNEQGLFRWISSDCIRSDMERFSESPLRMANIRPARHLERAPFSFLRDTDTMTADEIDADPIYNEFLRPLGLGWTMGDVIQEPSGHLIMFDILRRTDRGPFADADVDRLNALKPDLSRAALLTSRLSFQQARGITQTLSAVGLPAAVLGGSGKVLAANGELEQFAPRISIGARDQLSISQPSANALLQAIVQDLQSGAQPTVQTIPVAGAVESKPLILHIIPVRRDARDIFSRCAAIIVATPVGEVGPPDVRVLCGLFDLTPGEARIAREIAMGESVEKIALKTGLSVHTVRTYLKLIFSKTGTSRQSQLAALLSGLPAGRD